MKLVNNVAVATVALEQMALENLKYACLEKDSLNPLYLPLAEENVINGTDKFIDALCDLYNRSNDHSGIITNWGGRFDGAVIINVEYSDGTLQEEILSIPSNLDVIIAFYHAFGRHRKAAMLIRKYKK